MNTPRANGSLKGQYKGFFDNINKVLIKPLSGKDRE